MKHLKLLSKRDKFKQAACTLHVCKTGKTGLVNVTELPHSYLHVHMHASVNCVITKGDLVEIMGTVL